MLATSCLTMAEDAGRPELAYLDSLLSSRNRPPLPAFRQPGDEESIRKVLKDGRLRMALIEEFTKQSVPWFVNFTMLLCGFT